MRLTHLSILLATALTGGACSTAVDDSTQAGTADLNAAPECNPLRVRTSANVGDVTGLATMGSTPRPTLGPDAEGYFYPAPGYVEGGTFKTPSTDPRWNVDAGDIAPPAAAGSLRIIEWNVERGNQLDKAIKLMKKLNGDVWLVDESDLYGKNSGGLVVAREVARALGYSYYTGIEFYERRDDRRGTSGNAIISRFPLTDTRAIEIPILESEGGHDWSKDGAEPRCGQRAALTARIKVPTTGGGTRQLRLVGLHTENKSNPAVRVKQYDHVVSSFVTPGEPTIFAGDLNTISGGEGSAFRDRLAAKNASDGRARSLFDCSRGDDATTFSAALIVRLRIDWMLVQSGDGESLDCPAKSYKVVGNDGSSDHKPVITEFTVR